MNDAADRSGQASPLLFQESFLTIDGEDKLDFESDIFHSAPNFIFHIHCSFLNHNASSPKRQLRSPPPPPKRCWLWTPFVTTSPREPQGVAPAFCAWPTLLSFSGVGGGVLAWLPGPLKLHSHPGLPGSPLQAPSPAVQTPAWPGGEPPLGVSQGPCRGGRAGNLWCVESVPSQHTIYQGHVFLGKPLPRGTLFPASGSPSGAPRVHGQARASGEEGRGLPGAAFPSEMTDAFPQLQGSA